MASGDAVQKIKDRLSIIDVVSPYVELHKAGKHLKGKSPFVNEKTPSFFVSPDRGMYYCFSSSQGGDIFTFIQTIEGVDFKGALKILADKAGVELVPEDPKKRNERDIGYAVLEEAASFFEKQFTGTKEAQTYLKNRGVKLETIANWRIGYAPGPPNGGWRELRSALLEQNHTDAQLLSVGLIKHAGEGKEPYDVFRDRIMFPIFDPSGRVVAFSGRILSKDSDAPKYVNSPETEFFNKSEILYGYHRAKQGIRQHDFSLIVEGQFDVVLCHQAGYTNTVAVSGTALTAHHIGLLQRLSNRIVLALDADKAGIAAVKRASDLMLTRGIDVKVARMPNGIDPADIIKKDPKEFKQTIGKATHVIEFLLSVIKEEAKDARTYKLRVRDEVLPYIVHMQNKIDAEHFEEVIADAIGATKESVYLEVARLREEALQHINTSMVKPAARAQKVHAVQMSRKDDLKEYLLVAAQLLDEKERDIVLAHLHEITKEDQNKMTESISPDKKSKLLFTLESSFDQMQKRQILEELHASMRELRLLILRQEIGLQKELLYEAERDGDDKKAQKLLEKITVLQKELAQASVMEDIFVQSQDS